MNHPQPMQPIITDENGTFRFRKNAIVRYLRDSLNLNDLAEMAFPQSDWDQFIQLIGYSLDGYIDNPLVSDEAKLMVEQLNKK